MPCWLPAHLLDVSLCVKLCLLMDFLCVFFVFLCVSEAQSHWIDRFGCYCSGQEVLTLFFLLGCWIGEYSLLCSGQDRPLQMVIDARYSMCYRCTGKLWLLREYVLLERHEVRANICMSNHRAIWRLF